MRSHGRHASMTSRPRPLQAPTSCRRPALSTGAGHGWCHKALRFRRASTIISIPSSPNPQPSRPQTQRFAALLRLPLLLSRTLKVLKASEATSKLATSTLSKKRRNTGPSSTALEGASRQGHGAAGAGRRSGRWRQHVPLGHRTQQLCFVCCTGGQGHRKVLTQVRNLAQRPHYQL